MLEKEYKFYQDNKNSLVAKYDSKFIVIAGNEIIGSYEKREEALVDALKTHKMGQFLIQKVSKIDDETIQRFSSRVYV